MVHFWTEYRVLETWPKIMVHFWTEYRVLETWPIFAINQAVPGDFKSKAYCFAVLKILRRP